MDAEPEKVEDKQTEVMEGTDTPAQDKSLPENISRDCEAKGRGRGGRTGYRGRGCRGMMMKGFRGRGGRTGYRGRGCRGMMMKGFRGRGRDGFTNGFRPMRRGMGRTWPYPDMHGRRGGPMRMILGPPPLPPPPPPMHRHGLPPPPPPGHPGFRGRPPHPRGRSMMPPGPPRYFHPRGYHNGSAPPLPRPPPGRGQRWPGPPGGRRF